MRSLLAGILLVALFVVVPTTATLAETRGEVEAIGFDWHYRPNCYIPMRVRVQADQSGTYQIRVVQDDLDADQPLFTQTISLTGSDDGGGGSGGGGSEQRFWVYFIPQPTGGGLPDPPDGLRALQQTLKVFLCDESGRQLVQLPVTSTLLNVERMQTSLYSNTRGVRLVLAVAEAGQQPVWRDYQQAMGTMEDVVFVTLRAADLPEDVRGYEAVDAIVWLNAPPPDPDKAADEKRYHALREYVRSGGHLVVCQPPQREATTAFADLLPVDIQEIAPRDTLDPLRRIATEHKRRQRPPPPPRDQSAFGFGDDDQTPRGPQIDDWDLPRPPFMFARAQLKEGAVADEWMSWRETQELSPYLARIGYGAGCVSWVAHDLSNPAITARTKSGWPYVWDRVLDYKHDLTIIDNRTSDEEKRPYAPGASADAGFALLKGMQLSTKTQLLVTIAVVFFIAYWVVAGPGVYLYLLTRTRPQLSWFLFAFSALVATVLTMLVVRLVVRGAPEMSHVTLVRSSPDAPTLSISRFGLYIPRDGTQEIALPQVQPRAVSYLTAYPAHPAHLTGSIDFPAHKQYVVPTRDPAEEEPVKLLVPYRSTMKQFQARRVGATAAGGAIQGKPRLREVEGSFVLEGTLLNATGQRLKNVYIVYRQGWREDQRADDYLYYLPVWEKSQTIDLAAEFAQDVKFIRSPGDDKTAMNAVPQDGYKIGGVLGRAGQDFGWTSYWYADLRDRSGMGAKPLNDLDDPVSKSFPLLSLFGRLPTMMNPTRDQRQDRVELLRRGGRDFDVSPAVAAGRLVVLAEADGEPGLPFPLEVEGDPVDGAGTLYYQSILPLERINLPPTSTPPTAAETASDIADAEVAATEAATTADEPPAAPAPENAFDPAAYTGPLNALTPEQRQEVLQQRRNAYLRQMEQQRRQQQQQ